MSIIEGYLEAIQFHEWKLPVFNDINYSWIEWSSNLFEAEFRFRSEAGRLYMYQFRDQKRGKFTVTSTTIEWAARWFYWILLIFSLSHILRDSSSLKNSISKFDSLPWSYISNVNHGMPFTWSKIEFLVKIGARAGEHFQVFSLSSLSRRARVFHASQDRVILMKQLHSWARHSETAVCSVLLDCLEKVNEEWIRDCWYNSYASLQSQSTSHALTPLRGTKYAKSRCTKSI